MLVVCWEDMLGIDGSALPRWSPLFILGLERSATVVTLETMGVVAAERVPPAQVDESSYDAEERTDETQLDDRASGGERG